MMSRPYSSINQAFKNKGERHSYIKGIAEFVRTKIESGWIGSLVTFQFKRLAGNSLSIIRRMKPSVQTVYRKLIVNVQRNPRTDHGAPNPILIGSADLPVVHHSK